MEQTDFRPDSEATKVKTYWFVKLSFFYIGVGLVIVGVAIDLITPFRTYQTIWTDKNIHTEAILDHAMFMVGVSLGPILLGMLIQKIVHHYDHTTVQAKPWK